MAGVPGVVLTASLPTSTAVSIVYAFCVWFYKNISGVIRSFDIALQVANVHDIPGPTIDGRCTNWTAKI